MRSMVFAAAVAALCACGVVRGQFLMMPDSTNSVMVLFDPFDGSVVDPAYFSLQGGTPVHALQVGEEIWVSEQVGDRISRWDHNGNPRGQIGPTFPGAGLDNIRGMGLIDGRVFVTNAGTQNGAPGAAIVVFDTDGQYLYHFSTVGLAPSPFGVLEAAHLGGMLVSSSSANDDIHTFQLDGTSIGTFHNSTALNFVEQMNYAGNGDVLATGFSSNNVVRMDRDTGAILDSFPGSGSRGVWELGNGNIMWTNGSGAHIYDPTTGVSTLVYSGGGRYIDMLDRQAPCYPDCDGNETLDFFDFLCFQNAFLAGDPYADCDNNQVLDFFDFLCFQNEFLAGCP
jgi:hypothetical protein